MWERIYLIIPWSLGWLVEASRKSRVWATGQDSEDREWMPLVAGMNSKSVSARRAPYCSIPSLGQAAAEAVRVTADQNLMKPLVYITHLFSPFALFVTWLFLLFLWILFCSFIENISKIFGSWIIYMYMCFCMHYCNKNIQIDINVKTGFSWFIESIFQIILHMGFLSKEFFDYKEKKNIVCNLFFEKNLPNARCSFVARKMYQKHILLSEL